MLYSQKYCLVHFVTPLRNNFEFPMDDWPLHVTLVDVFAISLEESGIAKKLEALCKKETPVKVSAESKSKLGKTPVVLLRKSDNLLQLHTDVVALLETNGAQFNNPEFTRSGFIGHSTIQGEEHLNLGQELAIDTLSLIDMFPNADWRQRKVLATFQL